MSAEKTDAIILRVVEYSETSCVVTVLSREFGKLSGLAKGARRKKSPFESALDLLSVVRLVFLRRSGGGLELLTEAKLERRFRSSARDLSRYYLATYLGELLLLFTEENDPHPALYDAAVAALSAIDSELPDPAWELLGFELRLLSELGHSPMLDGCTGCGESISGGRVHFGLLTGGLLCPRCRSGQQQVVLLSVAALGILRDLQAGSFTAVGRSNTEYGEVRGLMNHFENALLGRRPSSQAWLKQAGRPSARQPSEA